MTKRRRAPNPLPARRGPTPRGLSAKVQKPQAQPRDLEPALGLEPERYLRERIREGRLPGSAARFRDLVPLLSDPRALALTGDLLATRFISVPLDVIAGIESGGFIFGALVAARLNLGFVPIRKAGAPGRETVSVSYALLDGKAELHLQRDALRRGARVLLVDDILATGGTASAAGELVRRAGGQLVACVFVMEILGMRGRSALEPTPSFSLIHCD